MSQTMSFEALEHLVRSSSEGAEESVLRSDPASLSYNSRVLKNKPWEEFRQKMIEQKGAYSENDYRLAKKELIDYYESEHLLCKLMVLVAGVRTISAQLIFWDLVEEEKLRVEGDSGDNIQILEAIVKWPSFSKEEMKTTKRSVGMMDACEVIGFVEDLGLEKGFLLHVLDFKLIHKHDPKASLATATRQDQNAIALHMLIQKRSTKSFLGQTKASIESSTSERLGVPLCSNWWKNNFQCPKPDCKLRHYFVDKNEEERYDNLAKKRKEDIKREQDHCDPHQDSKMSHSKRAEIFVEWLVSTFGFENTNVAHPPILDIAGGRGSISFELYTKRNIPCVLIEPRDRKLDKKQRKYLKKHPHKATVVCEQLQELFDDKFLNTHPELLTNCKMLIGMHPDEATEFIIDSALRFGKPFAVVPCCVFGHLYPHRKIAIEQGTEKVEKTVVTYSEFIDYLCQKDPSIQVDYLPFEGRNKVLFKNS